MAYRQEKGKTIILKISTHPAPLADPAARLARPKRTTSMGRQGWNVQKYFYKTELFETTTQR